MAKRVLNDDFYKTFSKIYNAFLSFGLIPKDIHNIMMKIYDISSTTYYVYLRKCREIGYIETTYEEMKKKMFDRMNSQSKDVIVKDIQELIIEATSK